MRLFKSLIFLILFIITALCAALAVNAFNQARNLIKSGKSFTGPIATIQKVSPRFAKTTTLLNSRDLLLPDLIVYSITFGNPIQENDKIVQSGNVTITIRNAGKAASSVCKIKISLSSLNGGRVPVGLSGFIDCPALGPGETRAFSWPAQSAYLWPADHFRLTAEADSGNTVKESNESNNVKIFDFSVAAKQPELPHDVYTGGLTITGKSIPSEVMTGELTITVKPIPTDVNTPELTITGRSIPPDVTTGELTITGKSIPTDVTTGQLTITGK